jgi:hypothetical protein
VGKAASLRVEPAIALEVKRIAERHERAIVEHRCFDEAEARTEIFAQRQWRSPGASLVVASRQVNHLIRGLESLPDREHRQ